MAGLVLLDTNILLDCGKGYQEALDELAHWDNPAISAITWMELYGGADVDDIPRLDDFMADLGSRLSRSTPKLCRRLQSWFLSAADTVLKSPCLTRSFRRQPTSRA